MPKRRIVVFAKFVGTDSLGYLNNRSYYIKVSPNSNTIYRKDGKGRCKYGSLHAFLTNWRILKTIEA